MFRLTELPLWHQRKNALLRRFGYAWRTPNIHVVLISWEGQHDAAHATARAIKHTLRRRDRLSVIYSNHANADELGPGDWVKVPQTWYFGLKFAYSLKLAQAADVMLQVQTDAHSDNWPKLMGRLRMALCDRPRLGIWAPMIHCTPYPPRVAVLDRIEGGPLYHVAQTDGIVWALTRHVRNRLHRLSFDNNNLGWGIDYVAIDIARKIDREVLCDTGVTVRHPQTRGYSNDNAEAGMTAFLGQLPPEDRAQISRLQALIEQRRQVAGERTGRWFAMGGAIQLDDAAPLGGTAADIFVRRGRVFVRGAAGLNLYVGTGTQGEVPRPLKRQSVPPSLDEVPLSFRLSPAPLLATSVQINALGEWQMPNIPTARITFHDPGTHRTLSLGPPVTVPGGTGDLQFGVALAAHRCGATLRLRLDGGAQSAREIVMEVRKGVVGGTRIEGYSCHATRVPNADQPRTATLFLDFAGVDLPPGETVPPIVFVAHPHLTRDAAQPDLIWPHHIRAGSGEHTHWYATEDPLVPMELRLGATVLALSLDKPRLKVTLCAGEIFVTCFDGPVAVSLWVGEVVLMVIQADVTPQKLPWPGDIDPIAPVTLRDGSGTYVWWSGAISESG